MSQTDETLRFNPEPMVDAARVASTLNLPLYYLIDTRRRQQLDIPHYKIGGLVRYRLSEVAAWQKARSDASAPENAAVEQDEGNTHA